MSKTYPFSVSHATKMTEEPTLGHVIQAPRSFSRRLLVSRRAVEELSDAELAKALEDAWRAERESALVGQVFEAERLRRLGEKGAGK